MHPSESDRITLCTLCRHTGQPCRAGYDMLVHLRSAFARMGAAVPDDFEISGTVRVSTCTRPCMLAYQAKAHSAVLVGDVAPDHDIEALVNVAQARRGSCSDDVDELCRAMPSHRPVATFIAIESSRDALT